MRNSLRAMPKAPPKSRPLSAGVTFRRIGAASRCKNHTVELCVEEKAVKTPSSTPRFAGFSSHGAFVALLSKDLVNLGRSPDEITACRKNGVDMLLANLPRDGGGLKQLAEKVALLDSLILCLGETFGKKNDDGTRIGWVRRLLDLVDKSQSKASISTQCSLPMPYPLVHTGTQGTPICIPTTTRSTQCAWECAFPIRSPSTSSTCAGSSARDARTSVDRAINSPTKHPHQSASTESATQCSTESLRPPLRSDSMDVGTQIARLESIDAETQCTVALQQMAIDVGTQCGVQPRDSWTQMEDVCKDTVCVSTYVQCDREVADATNQCNISERKALHVPSVALSKARGALALEKEQGEALEKRNAALHILVGDLRAVDAAQASALGNYRQKVSELERKVEAYQKTTADKAVETQEFTVWTHSFQHCAPLIRTYDKEVQTVRRVADDYMPTPRLDSQMLAFANNFCASA
eukprot:GEMP01035029.1.p1 GENE.GEMP01035029.1~~GEMP01035029.1.p1  ORF type:complete len:466 (+),score=104.47 GEMP01035029.1:118-1515(+)